MSDFGIVDLGGRQTSTKADHCILGTVNRTREIELATHAVS